MSESVKNVSESEDGDDASTLALDDTDTAENRMKDLVESSPQEQFLPNESASNDNNLGPIPEEVPVNEDAEEHYEGAAGLWGEEYQLPCFDPNQRDLTRERRLFEDAEVQQSVFMDVFATSWMTPQAPQINVSHSTTSRACPGLDLNNPVFHNLETILDKSETNCGVCKRPINAERGIVLKDCRHTFCRRCLIHAIENKGRPVVRCPSKSFPCIGEVHDDEAKALLTPEAYEKYALDKQIKKGMVEEIEDMIENFEYVENKNVFNCEICKEDIVAGAGVTLKNCCHEYCKTCLSRYIENAEMAVVQCPFRTETGGKCIGFLMDSEVRSLVSAEIYRAHLKKSLDEAKRSFCNLFECKTPGCTVWVDIEGEIENFLCPGCNQSNCVKCAAVHQGVTCDAYQELHFGANRRARENVLTNNQVQTLIRTKEAQPCPSCNILVERNGGCLHMICTRCNTDFQWKN